jgi:ERCC4-type nuclease
MSEMGDIFDIANSLPLEGRYKYIQNLNEFGSDSLLLNVELMDLKLDPVAHIGKDNAREILEKVEEYVDKNRL